ncbi:PhnD/SsuA/transferrin family substrate-binding protein [Phenylobacterium sp. LjRoot225]|uniref:phosphate/phosphite/phosphonate ABC transporter substrate-binding protein n=1 Tax=Phenylobacterium sp. LjRoot225 TaxID=3342285 RepID=UPI003ECC1C18
MIALPVASSRQSAITTALPAVAALPMYDWPELQAANDALWSVVAERLAAAGIKDVPASLTRSDSLDAVWTSPSLLLAQTCGYPLLKTLAGRVQLVATPRYRAAGCEGPFRRSAIVVGAGAPVGSLAGLRGARCALNDRMSDSGMNLLRAAVAPLAGGRPFFSEVAVTGSHLASAEAVACGAADAAALDAVTYAHLQRWRPEIAQRLRLLQWTARTPGLPLITARTTDPGMIHALRQALFAAARDPRLGRARETLRLDGFSVLPLNYYQLTRHLEECAQALGYPSLQ